MTVTDPARLVAGVVWGSISGLELTSDERALLDAGLGGVVLFRRNVHSPTQLRRLTADIRAAATNPIVVAVDQEGGHIVRLGPPLTALPSPMAIGATGDERLAHAVARASAAELAACGIDVVCAPVLDVVADARSTVIGARSFGADARLVARLGRAMVRGYLDGGVLPVAKHAPGLGRTVVDSHHALPVLDADRAGLDSDLLPFDAAVAAGVPALMTAHVVNGAIDPDRPASLSAATTAILRRNLGFRGLIVTDALVMDAIAREQPLEDAATAALAAGADVVMALDAARRVIDRLADDVASGRLDADRVTEGAGRAAHFAQLAGRTGRAATPAPIGALPHRGAADLVARRSLTLVHGAAWLPLAVGRRTVVVDIAAGRRSPVDDGSGAGEEVGATLARAFDAPHVTLDPHDLRWLDAARAVVAAADQVVVLTRDAANDPATTELARSFLGDRAVHVALQGPGDLAIDHSGVAIATYHEGPAVATALGVALATGSAAFPGQLPVAIERLDSAVA